MRTENIQNIIQRIKVQVPTDKQKAKPRGSTPYSAPVIMGGKRSSDDDDVIVIDSPSRLSLPSATASSSMNVAPRNGDASTLSCVDCGVLLASNSSAATCCICERTCCGRLQLKLHARKHRVSPVRFQCNSCSGKATPLTYTDDVSTPKAPFKCGGCGSEWFDDETWLEHIIGCQYKPSERANALICRVRLNPFLFKIYLIDYCSCRAEPCVCLQRCDVHVDWDDLLRHDATHEQRHNNDAMLTCPVCDVNFDSADELNEHSRESQCDQNQAIDYTLRQV